MADKTLQDFFGNNVTTDGASLTFNPNDAIKYITGEPFDRSAEVIPPEEIVTALIAYWFSTNYSDAVTGNRLSQDRTVPLVSNSATVRKNLTTRGDETQVKHDFSFSVYTKDNSDFNPDNLVRAESQSEESSSEGI